MQGELEKRAKQNKKLLNEDFPWLHAIREFWDLSAHISVVEATLTICAFTSGGFFGLPISSIYESAKVYVHYKKKGGFGTLCVKREEAAEGCWADKILNAIPPDAVILNIAIDGEYGVTVYRLRKKDALLKGVTLKEMLMGIKFLSRVT